MAEAENEFCVKIYTPFSLSGHLQIVLRSHGGYTPLHLAAQHGHQGAFDLLVQAYRADANLRYMEQLGNLGDPFDFHGSIFRPKKTDPA